MDFRLGAKPLATFVPIKINEDCERAQAITPKIHLRKVYTQSISSCDEALAKMSSGAYKLVCEQRIKPTTKSQLERRRVYSRISRHDPALGE